MFLLIDINIHEVALHSSLWNKVPQHTTPHSLSLVRLKMLHLTMEGATSYLATLLEAPQSQLYHLGLGSWAGWFYALVVVCKLVFLQENERSGRAALEDLSGEIDNLIPPDIDGAVQPEDTAPPLESSTDESGWSAVAVARGYNIRGLFERFTQKLRCTLEADGALWRKPREERDSLYAIACIQHIMTAGFIKRFDRRTADANREPSTAQSGTHEASNQGQWQPAQPFQPASVAQGQSDILSLPFSNFMHFDAINFDGITLPDSTFPPQAGEEILGDWMWNMVMDDFTMPTM
jgi:hypothetical protein